MNIPNLKTVTAIVLLITLLINTAACNVNFSVPTKAQVDTDDIKVDVDLSVMSGTVVYSAVYDMLNNPDQYRGQMIKMKGQFMVYDYEDTGNYYFTCLIQDATACCQQGLEFTYKEEYKYPADFPEPGEDITVCGIFDTYEEKGYTYCRLKDSVICQSAS